jgi:hypothetical protein
MIAKLVNTYPSIPSMGDTTPTKLVRTSGNKQYPSTDADRVKVRVLERCEDWAWRGEDEVSRGGDMSERMRCKDVEPRRASPYIYPKCTFPENRRKVPKRRKNSIGPARSESSIICWSIEARGLSTANVFPDINI